jgi:hypothetical protein
MALRLSSASTHPDPFRGGLSWRNAYKLSSLKTAVESKKGAGFTGNIDR